VDSRFGLEGGTMADEAAVARRSEEDGVEILVLNHPSVNALSTALIADLDRRVGELATDPKVRAVVLTGEGQYFSAGADVKEMATLDLATAPEVVRKGLAVYGRLSSLRVPVIAAINGLALGGGLELALACDLRLAGESAKLGAPEVTLGLIPAYGGTQRLPRLVGVAKAKELIFTGAMISAAEALRIGLVNKTVPAGQELRAARDLAHTIAQRAPKAVQAAKRAIVDGLELSLADGIANETKQFETEVLPSSDLGEGIAAFVERRPPKFQGA
jgi:enoyl-CoA hydratase/carnithine racemase